MLATCGDIEPAIQTSVSAAASRASRASSTARRLIATVASPSPACSSTWRAVENVLAMITSAPARM